MKPKTLFAGTSLALVLALVAACGGSGSHHHVADSPEARQAEAETFARLSIEGGSLDDALEKGADLGEDYSIDMLAVELGRELRDEELKAVRKIMRDALSEILTPEIWTETLVSVCTDHFTAGELHEINEFLQSPTGAKFLSIESKLTQEVNDRADAVFDEEHRHVHRAGGRGSGPGIPRDRGRGRPMRERRLPAAPVRLTLAALTLMAVTTTLTPPVPAQANVAQTIRYGKVVAVDEAVVETKTTNTGATVGASAGAVAGYALADGGDRWLGGFLGGVLGGAAGRGVENASRKKKGWSVIVKIDDGGEIAIDIPGKKLKYNPGDRVRIMTGPGGETKLQVITE